VYRKVTERGGSRSHGIQHNVGRGEGTDYMGVKRVWQKSNGIASCTSHRGDAKLEKGGVLERREILPVLGKGENLGGGCPSSI